MPARDSFSTEPLYLQVRRLLAEQIARSVWAPGAMLPNELELARELGVSAGTVRKALGSLESDKLITRRRGRGTFVVDQAAADVAVRFSNIRDGTGQRIVGDMEQLSQGYSPATDIEQQRLQLGPGALVLRLTRLRRHQGRLFMYEEAALAADRFPGLGGAEIGTYRITALAQRHGVHLAQGLERVMLAQATPEIARLLEVASFTPLLQLDRVVLAMTGEPVEWRVGFCHLDEHETYFGEMS